MQTLDQLIAKATYAQFQILCKQVPTKELKGYIKKTATRLRMAGMGTTIAFCQKDENLKAVATALALSLRTLPGVSHINTADDLLKAYRERELAEIRHLSSLAETCMEWLSKWADADKTTADKTTTDKTTR